MKKIKLSADSPLLAVNSKVKEALIKQKRDKYGFRELKVGEGQFYEGANVKTVSAAACGFRAKVNPNFYSTCSTVIYQGKEGVVLKRITRKEWLSKKSAEHQVQA